MTAHQKLMLIRHLEQALRTYEWEAFRNRLGINSSDPGMRSMSEKNMKEREEAATDCRSMIEFVQKMETVG